MPPTRGCHWLGQCFGDDFCKAMCLVRVPLEKRPVKCTASPSEVPRLTPETRRNVNRPVALAQPVAHVLRPSSNERKPPPGKPVAFGRGGRVLASNEREPPPGKPVAFGRGGRAPASMGHSPTNLPTGRRIVKCRRRRDLIGP